MSQQDFADLCVYTVHLTECGLQPEASQPEVWGAKFHRTDAQGLSVPDNWIVPDLTGPETQ